MNLLITTNEHLCVHLQVHHAQVAKALAPALLRSQLNAERDARAAQIASNTGEVGTAETVRLGRKAARRPVGPGYTGHTGLLLQLVLKPTVAAGEADGHSGAVGRGGGWGDQPPLVLAVPRRYNTDHIRASSQRTAGVQSCRSGRTELSSAERSAYNLPVAGG